MDKEKLRIINKISKELDLDKEYVKGIISHYEHSVSKAFRDKDRRYDKIIMFGFGYFNKIRFNGHENKRD